MSREAHEVRCWDVLPLSPPSGTNSTGWSQLNHHHRIMIPKAADRFSHQTSHVVAIHRDYEAYPWQSEARTISRISTIHTVCRWQVKSSAPKVQGNMSDCVEWMTATLEIRSVDPWIGIYEWTTASVELKKNNNEEMKYKERATWKGKACRLAIVRLSHFPNRATN
jgi:hypothetical protein